MICYVYSLGFWELQSQMQRKKEIEEKGFENHGGICAVCLNQIVLEETALVKGCEHAYWFVQSIPLSTYVIGDVTTLWLLKLWLWSFAFMFELVTGIVVLLLRFLGFWLYCDFHFGW